MSMPSSVSRRQRLRQELTAEIKRVALDQLADGGPQAINLRAIARALGISPAALYGYFASLDDLYNTLITDGFNALAQHVEEAIGAHTETRRDEQLLAALLAYRAWAIEHPELFRLLYFSPIPGYTAPPDGPSLDAALRVSAAFLRLLVAGWKAGFPVELVPGPPVDPHKFVERFGLEITSDQLRASVSCWGQFHGLVCLEVGGHISDQWTDPAALYESSMRAMLRRMSPLDDDAER
jgi:AcrR family transcriptional regulator